MKWFGKRHTNHINVALAMEPYAINSAIRSLAAELAYRRYYFWLGADG